MTKAGDKPLWRRVLDNVLAFAVLAGFATYLWLHREQLLTALDATICHALALAGLIGLAWLIAGWQTRVVFHAVDVRISLWEGVMLVVAGGFGNHLPMRAGTITRAVYLKRVHGLGLARFGGVTAMRALLTFVAAGITGLLALAVVWLQGTSRPLELLIVFLVIALGPVALLAFSVPSWRWLPARVAHIATDLTGAYDQLRRKPRVAAQVVALFVAQYLVLGVRFVVSADATGAELPLGSLLLMAPLAALMMLVALTPGGLGLREAVLGYVTWNLGFSAEQGVFIGTVDRAVLLAMTAVFGGLTFMMVMRRMGRAQAVP